MTRAVQHFYKSDQVNKYFRIRPIKNLKNRTNLIKRLFLKRSRQEIVRKVFLVTHSILLENAGTSDTHGQYYGTVLRRVLNLMTQTKQFVFACANSRVIHLTGHRAFTQHN